MAKTQTVNLEVNSNIEETTKQVTSLKAELRKAQAEVAAMSEEFGATSKQAIEAAKRAAELKDAIGDAKALTEAFNPDAKFKALAGAANIASGALAGFEGAMGLVGVQSEDAQAAILKVQSALALSQGLDVLQEIPDTFKNIKAVAIDAFNGIKGAIGATGIGLLVIALGTLVTYWDDIKKAVTGATKETKAYSEANKSVADTLNKTFQDLTSVKNAIDNAKKGILNKTDALKIYNEKLGDALGKTDSLEIAEQRMAKNTARYVQAQIARANAQYFVAKASELAAKQASGEGTDLSWWQEFKTSATKAILGVGEAAKINAKYISENSKETSNQIKFYNDLAIKETQKADKISTEIGASEINRKYDASKKNVLTEAEKLKKIKELNDKYNKTLGGEPEAPDTKGLENKAFIDAKFKEDELAREQQHQLAISKIQYDSETERQAREAEARQQRIEAFQAQTDAIGSIAQSGENLLSSLQATGLARGKAGQAAMKALALVQIGADSAIAFSKMMQGTEISAAGAATSVPPPAAPATYLATKIAFYASGSATILANLARAKALLSGGTGGVGATARPSIPSAGGGAAPQFNVVGNSGVNQIAETMNRQAQSPIQAYVVANNVTTAQSLNRNIVQNASLG